MTGYRGQKTEKPGAEGVHYGWFAGANDEFYDVGPFDTKAQVIAAGCVEFEGCFEICFARFMESRFDVFDAETLWDEIREVNADCGYDDAFGADFVTSDMVDDLEKRVNGTVKKWATDHGIDGASRAFGAISHQQTVTIDANIAASALEVRQFSGSGEATRDRRLGPLSAFARERGADAQRLGCHGKQGDRGMTKASDGQNPTIVFSGRDVGKLDEGPWISLSDGRRWYMFWPRSGGVDFEDIALSLSRIARFAGRTAGARAYNVAQHSVLVAKILPPRWQLQGLLHDAHEAFIGDITSPLKRALDMMTPLTERSLADGLRDLERVHDQAIFAAAGVHSTAESCGAVKAADLKAFATEARDLMPGGCGGVDAWGKPLPEPLALKITPQTARQAERSWLKEFARLTGSTYGREGLVFCNRGAGYGG